MHSAIALPASLQQAIQSGDTSKALDATVEYFSCAVGSVHWFNPTKNLLELAAQTNLPPQVAELVRAVPLGKGIAGAAAQRREPVSICNLQTDTSGTVQPSAKTTGMEGALAVPILKGDQLLGVIGIGKSQAYEWSTAEMALLTQIGRAVGDCR